MGLKNFGLASLALGLLSSVLVTATPMPAPKRPHHQSDFRQARSAKYKSVPSGVGLRKARVGPSAGHVSRLAQGEALLYATGYSFLAEIGVGDQTFVAVLDTGSSDTWLVESDFTCVDATNATQPQAACGFGPLYTPDSTFSAVANENFNITYGDGEYLNGYFGLETVTIAGIAVTAQQFGLATLAYWNGDQVSSGLIGLAYPGLASAYPGSNPALDDYCSIGEVDCNQIQYSTLINSIFFVENLTDSVFALALSRDESQTNQAGVLTIGGIPDSSDPTINASSTVATTPISIFPQDNRFRFYMIDVPGLVYGSIPPGSGQGAGQYIVDSGTTLNYFPTNDAAAFNTLFQPPGYINDTLLGGGYWYVDCDSTFVPALGVEIGGQVFYHNAADLVLSNGDGTCISGVQDSGNTGLNILGDVFMNNVLAIFDVGASTMGFSSRMFYAS